MADYDFSGYATKNDLKCADGRVIRRDAFKDNDGSVVPLVWQHQHNDPINVLGHALLENRSDGVYAYCSLNESDMAKTAKELVRHGDISSMSIYANRLKQQGSDVVHGVIREVSLVLAGANPGAYIEDLCFGHSDSGEEVAIEANIFSDQVINTLSHADSNEEKKEENVAESDETVQDIFNTLNDKQKDMVYYLIAQAVGSEGEDEEMEHADMDEDDPDGETIQDVFNTLNEKQKNVVYYLIAKATEGDEVEIDEEETIEQSDIYEGDDTMMHNVFEGDVSEENTLSHSEMTAIFDDAKRNGSLKDSVLSHGIESIDILFPEARAITPTPDMIARPNAWVTEVWNATKKSPFSRVKSVAANVTADEARAKGYIKGKKKVEEVIKVLKRATTPQTVYKLQKMDRDDIIDITDFDVVVWIKAEMRMMLDEELARAILVGDGRDASSEEKINEENIRPIYQDDDVYTIHKTVEYPTGADETDISNALVDAALRSRKNYMGSGNPAFYASTDVINDMLLAKDKIGRRLYSTTTELADALRVSKIVEVPVLEGVKRTSGSGASAKTHELIGLIVNLGDYTVGADKGGEINLFDDFDLNYNKYEYLIETRCSGALTKPYSAIALEKDVVSAEG